MAGFFQLDDDFEIPSQETRPARVSKTTSKRIRDNSNPCSICGLSEGCLSPKMSITGEGREGIYIRAEAPGETEDKQNEQLIGQAGSIIRDCVSNFGYDLDKDFWKDNSVRCRPPKNREPNNTEIACCRNYIEKDLIELKPEKIILAGNIAIKSFYSHRINKVGGIGRWGGYCIPDQQTQSWVFPIYHPSFVLRSFDKELTARIFREQIRTALEWNEPFPVYYNNEDEKITRITDLQEARRILLMILKKKPPCIAFDYEANSKNPFVEGFKLISIAISLHSNQAYAMPMFDDPLFRTLLKRILTDRNIKKIAHNMKFEEMVTLVALGYAVQGWTWCSMTSAHIINNAHQVTGLKFQVYIHFGVLGYDNDVEDYIAPKEGKKLNTLHLLPIEKVLLYNGFDAMYTFRLAEIQMKYMKENNLSEAYHLLHEGNRTLVDIERRGICCDAEYYEKQTKHLEIILRRFKDRLKNSKEVALLVEHDKKPLNPNLKHVISDNNVRTILFDILKLKSKVKTAKKGVYAVGEKVLEKIKHQHPFITSYLQIKKLNKVLNTYVRGFIKYVHKGLLHAQYHLNIARSFRSSSTNPNFQNIPVRNLQACRITRSGIKPSPGNVLLEVDYKTLEVCIGYCYHLDPVMLFYLSDRIKNDMHRDMAYDVFLLDSTSITKWLRFYAKNRAVFPFFYGSYWEQAAPELWDIVVTEKIKNGQPLRDHLYDKNIKNFGDFEAHVRAVENRLWKKFNVYYKWKEDFYQEYRKNGYFDYFTGFRVSGLMKKNEVVNYPIQGSAFHCLLWALIELNKLFKRIFERTKIVAQIHDNMIIDAHPDELPEAAKLVKRVSCDDVRDHYPWINIPLCIDAEVTDVDGNWFEKEEYPIM